MQPIFNKNIEHSNVKNENPPNQQSIVAVNNSMKSEDLDVTDVTHYML